MGAGRQAEPEFGKPVQSDRTVGSGQNHAACDEVLAHEVGERCLRGHVERVAEGRRGRKGPPS